MDRLAFLIERCSGVLLGAVAVITVVEVVLRQFFGLQVPDAYTIAGFMQGVAIFWGIATAALAGRHIAVDILWSALGQRGKRSLDIFATSITALALAILSWMMAAKVISAYESGETTFELAMPIWPLVLAATAGATGAALLALLRLRRLLRSSSGSRLKIDSRNAA